MTVKLIAALLVTWCVLVSAFLVNATMGVWVDPMNPVLRPLPQLLLVISLLVWFVLRPAARPARRFALIFGLTLFALGDVALAMTDQQPAGILLYFCGFLAYGVWAARGLSTDHWRWLLIVPIVGVALLMTYWLWPVYGLLREAVVLYAGLLGLVTVLLIICPVLPWWAAAGPLSVAASQGLWAANEFLAGVPHATLSVMVAYYLGHLLLVLGVISLSAVEDAPAQVASLPAQ